MIILVFLLFLGKYLKIVIEAIFYRHNSLFIKLLKQSRADALNCAALQKF